MLVYSCQMEGIKMSKVIHNTTVKFGQAFKALDTPNRIGGYLVALAWRSLR